MQRRPEKEVMDDEANALAYARADFDEPHEHFIALLQDRLGTIAPQRVLDLGCGPCDIGLRLARCYPGSQVTAVDASAPMLRHAQQAIHAAGQENRFRLLHHYLGHDSRFESHELVVSNSLLHHLADPMVLWTILAQQYRQGARIFVMDLRRPASEAAARALVERYAGGESPVLQHDFYQSLLAAYTVEEIAAQLRGINLALQVETVSDRHLIAYGAPRQTQPGSAG